MKKISLLITFCLIEITVILLGVFCLDYIHVKKVCGDIIVKDLTENEESSFVSKLVECKKTKLDDEKNLEKELVEENEGFNLQDENISYNGDSNSKWNIKLGDYKGLTYYSQLDSRWKNDLYTAIGDKSQTIGSSGCGPATASMIISSIKGDIKPDKMAEIFVKYGYRSPNNGTYWSAYRAIADQFDIDYVETNDLEKAIDLLENNYYIIASCGNGLFTTGGHYIVLVGIKNNVFKIYDPYLYTGKFNVSTRRGKVIVKENTVYCTKDNFSNYANYKKFFCYQNFEQTNHYEMGQRVLVSIPVKIAAKENERLLVDDGKTQFWVNEFAVIDNKIYGIVTICYENGDNYIIQFFFDQFWCTKENIVKSIP